MNEVYNLERVTALENRIDPTGKKWVIKGNRESALVHARPDPDRVDAQIPKMFAGRWTSPSVLQLKIDGWLNREWDKSDAAANKSRLKAHALLNQVEEAKKITPEEGLDALSDEIKQELGLDNAKEDNDGTSQPEDTKEINVGSTHDPDTPSEVPKEALPKAGKGSSTKANKNGKEAGTQRPKRKRTSKKKAE